MPNPPAPSTCPAGMCVRGLAGISDANADALPAMERSFFCIEYVFYTFSLSSIRGTFRAMLRNQSPVVHCGVAQADCVRRPRGGRFTKEGGGCVSKRLTALFIFAVAILTVLAFSVGPIGAQGTGTPGATGSGTGTAGTGTGGAAPTATRAATTTGTVAATTVATRASGSAVATGTGGGSATTTLPSTGQAQGGSINPVLIEVLLLAVAGIGAGFLLRRRASRT
jgi:MYXO-CTERM domain-containing protein